tara:strand:- start:1066 stop:1494 length:429 start_codon:yes stop_codon:yes gene_type:complete
MNTLVSVVSDHLVNNNNLENLDISDDIITELKNIDFSNYSVTPGCYNRNSLFNNDMFEIILLVWDEDSVTPLHNHPDNGCILILLEGDLKEKIINSYMTIHHKIKPGKYSYIDNNIGKHVIKAIKKSLSIHIYSPPFFYQKK